MIYRLSKTYFRAINGAVTEPKDFASYLLAILIVNGLIYLLFYVVMKVVTFKS